MYQYEYETVEFGSNGYSLFGGIGLTAEGYREIVSRRAAEGWRFVACVPVTQRAGGFIECIDLVFEKDAG